MSIPNGPNTANIIGAGTMPDGTQYVVYRSAPLSSGPQHLEIDVTTYSPMVTVLPKPKPDLAVYPKLSGSLRNQPCPKCHQKMKRCVCAHGGAK